MSKKQQLISAAELQDGVINNVVQRLNSSAINMELVQAGPDELQKHITAMPVHRELWDLVF